MHHEVQASDACTKSLAVIDNNFYHERSGYDIIILPLPFTKKTPTQHGRWWVILFPPPCVSSASMKDVTTLRFGHMNASVWNTKS